MSRVPRSSNGAAGVKTAGLLVILVAMLAVPVVAWAQNAWFEPVWPDSLVEVSRLLALLGYVILFVQFVLSSRIRLFEAELGLDRLYVVHRAAGVTALTMLFLHGALYTTFELALGFISLSAEKLLGVLALVILILVAAIALAWKAFHWSYETWKRIHWLSYLLLPLVFIHSLLIGTTVKRSPMLRIYFLVLLCLFGLIVLVRLIAFLRIRSAQHAVADVVHESHDITSIYIEGPKLRHLPGQFMVINLAPALGVAHSHPLTISSGPDDPLLRVSAKAVGDWSSAVAETTVGARVFVDGPYGVFSYTRVPGESLVFIAGGIGITPFLSQLRNLRSAGDASKVRLIWGNKTQDDICFTDELSAAEHELDDFSMIHVLSNDDAWNGEKGFVTGDLIRKYVDDMDEAEFFLCGPPVMMRLVVAALRELGVPRSRIHFEQFAL
jgi:predicted ferric reductase